MTTTVGRRPSLWRNRDFLVIWSGQIVSTLGSRVSAMAMPLLVLSITGSAADAGVVAAAASLPYLVANLLAGTLVDRWDRRRVMLAGQLSAGAALASICVAWWLGVLTLPHLVIAAFVQGVCFVFYGLAEEAALPQIVPAVLLPAAIAQNEAKTRGAGLAGPPVGGALFGVGQAVPFLASALSYLVAAFALLFVRSDLRGERAERPGSFWHDTTAGLRWLWGHPLIRAAVLLVAASNMIFAGLALVLVVLAEELGASSAETGVMMGVYGGGGLLGAVVAGRLHRRFSPRTVIIGVNWVWAVLLPLIAVAPHPLVAGLIAAGTSFVGPMWNIVIGTYQMTLVPNGMLGRVSSAGMTLSWGVIPVGSLAAGHLLTVVTPRVTMLVLGAGMLVTALAATASTAVRHAPPLPAGDTPR
ncbi:MFS transporter [Microtetraspora sp. NBRC 16547]|uniref:MFS transporter n=1 Tax=Microtetraspora sp. NBRC 16547 TaxID=3030993 RepID=UPI0024A09F7F|nr:MFS transporter [Microtetraspora sp. NBRC 16547]GLW98558.1 MFS transporter [Microtetraspora sp. NBRC 16547]